MKSRKLGAALGWLRARAEQLAVILMAAMFVAFILQIASRYVVNRPLAWTEEVESIAWVWGVLFGAAFVLREHQEIRFDVIYSAVPPRVRRLFTIVTSLALVALYAYSLPAIAQYVAFMKAERSARLGIPFNLLYSVYVAFAAAAIVRYASLGWQAIRGRTSKVEFTSGSAL